jgi:hypothetical protein
MQNTVIVADWLSGLFVVAAEAPLPRQTTLAGGRTNRRRTSVQHMVYDATNHSAPHSEQDGGSTEAPQEQHSCSSFNCKYK